MRREWQTWYSRWLHSGFSLFAYVAGDSISLRITSRRKKLLSLLNYYGLRIGQRGVIARAHLVIISLFLSFSLLLYLALSFLSVACWWLLRTLHSGVSSLRWRWAAARFHAAPAVAVQLSAMTTVTARHRTYAHVPKTLLSLHVPAGIYALMRNC